MTKRIIFLLIILTFLISACSIGGNNTNVQNTENDQNNNDQNLDENSDDPEYSPASSVATCVSSAAFVEIELEAYDRVKGAVEDYKVTIVEYGDFQ